MLHFVCWPHTQLSFTYHICIYMCVYLLIWRVIFQNLARIEIMYHSESKEYFNFLHKHIFSFPYTLFIFLKMFGIRSDICRKQQQSVDISAWWDINVKMLTIVSFIFFFFFVQLFIKELTCRDVFKKLWLCTFTSIYFHKNYFKFSVYFYSDGCLPLI